MNREIKFRVWLKNEKKMVEVTEINFKEKFIKIDEPYYSKINFCGIVIPFDQIELMQYTGLKDRNGVEIYEGDIVRLWYTFENEYFEEKTLKSKGVIKFDRGMFTVFFEGYDYYVDTDGLILEVIDNIYENKELLEN